MIEEWRVIPGYSSHEASSLGRIRRSRRCATRREGTIVAQHMITCLEVSLIDDQGKRSMRPVSLLVCMAFHGERPSPKHGAVHVDGLENTSDNLKWGTKQEESQNRKRRGTQAYLKGEQHYHVLTDELVIELRRLRAMGWSYPELGEYFGKNEATLSAAVSGENWPHLPGAIPRVPRPRRRK